MLKKLDLEYIVMMALVYALTGFLMAGLVVGFGSLAFDVIAYLQSGIWPARTLLDIPLYFDMPWAKNPDSWFGVHNILMSLPLWTAAVISFVVWLVCTFTLASLIRQR